MTVPEQAATRAERLRLAIATKRAGEHATPPELARRPAGEAARLGELQRGLWFVHQVDPLSPAYNLYRAFRVDGRLDESRLLDALQAVVARHRILRSTFRAEGDTVLQVVHEHMPAAVTRIMAERGAGTLTLADAVAQPFDLARGPLVRLCIVEEQSGGGRSIALALHHILADEPALDLVWREIAGAYERGPGIGTVAAAQYDDYVYWSRQRDRAAHDADREYWRHRLDPLPEELRLPFERQAPAGDRAERRSGRLIRSASTGDVGPDIHRLAAIAGVSPFVVCAFAFRVLLHRYTEGQRLAFGTPVTARTPATAEMVGYFLNAVVVYADVDEQRTVREALIGFGQEMVQSLAHATAPFDEIAAASGAPRHADRHPLFQAMFVYQDAAPAPALADVPLEPLTLDLGGSKFDFTLFATEVPGALEVAVEYRTDRFDEASMRSMIDHFQVLVGELALDAGRRVADVPWIGSAEDVRLAEWENGPALDADDPDLVPQQILERIEDSADRLAVACGGERQDYSRFGNLASSIAQHLRAAGVMPGDRVAVFLDRSASMIAALVGAHLAGAAYVPLDPAYPVERNEYLLRDAAVAAVITTRSLRERLPPGPWPTIAVDALVDGPEVSRAIPALSAALPAYILYTSGSTGRPKGVVITHDNLRRSTQARLQVYAAPPGRFLLLSSVAFDSSVAGIFWTLATGGTLVVPTDEEVRDARTLARLIDEAQVTTLLCIPSLYAQLLGSGAERLRRLSSVIVAGERCPSELVAEHFRTLPHVRLFNEYGPTEATVWATVHAVAPADAAGIVPVGRPIPGVRVEIRDGLNRRVPAGVPGEAWIGGPTVAAGYWQQGGLTGERFVTDDRANAPGSRRYRTGDRMAWTAEGRLLFLGRDDEQIKLRGYRIEPGEIEAALLEHPAVVEAAVVAVVTTTDAAHTHLVAFVVAAAGRTIDDWRAHLAARLPEHMIPVRVEALPCLPQLPNGKVDRRQLAAAPAPDRPSSADDDRPTAMEGRLIALWEDLLRRGGIRASDNFFELGGHSLLVMQMLVAIERDCGVALPAATVFQHPTVRDLARCVETQGGGAGDAFAQLFPIQTTGRRTPLVMAVPDFFVEALAGRFRGERPVFGVRGVSLRAEGNRGRWPTLTHLAEEVVGELRRRIPEGPYYIAGYSFGAWIAIEVARVLERQGVPARRLFVIAPMPVDFYRAGPLRVPRRWAARTGLGARHQRRAAAASSHPAPLQPRAVPPRPAMADRAAVAAAPRLRRRVSPARRPAAHADADAGRRARRALPAARRLPPGAAADAHDFLQPDRTGNRQRRDLAALFHRAAERSPDPGSARRRVGTRRA